MVDLGPPDTTLVDSSEADRDRTVGQFTTAKLQALLDANVHPAILNRRDLAKELGSRGVGISVHGVEAWFRRVDSNYNQPRTSLSPNHASFNVPPRRWPALLELFGLDAQALDRTDEDFAHFCLAGLKEPGESVLAPLDISVAEHLPGREEILLELLHEARDSVESSARMVLLEGSAGLGKTSLMAELVRRIRASNRLCITASCTENAYLPLLPLLDLVRLQLDEVARGGPEAVRLAQELSRRIELANQGGEAGTPTSVTVSGATATDTRTMLFLLGSDLLVALARHAPLVVVIDDVHWLDSTTRDLLLHFARFLRLNPHHHVLLVLAGREFSRELLHQLPTGDFTRRLSLEPLTKEATRRAAKRLLGSELSPPAREYLWNITRGNPLYVEQLCMHLSTSGQLEDRNGALTLTGPADAIQVPETLDDFYRRRFDRLDPTAARLLQLAACVGAQLHPEFLQLLTPGANTETLMAALARAENTGLLSFARGGYEFCHPVARHAVYVAMSDAERSRQHSLVAAAIAESLPNPTPHASIELAYHLVRGRPFTNASDALHACRIAAGHSHSLAAWPSAEYFVTNALELAAEFAEDDEGGLDGEQQGELLRLRGSSRHQTAQPEVALQDLTLALERFQAAQNTEEYARTLSLVVRIQSNFGRQRGASDEAAEELGQYIALLDESSKDVAAGALEVLASYRLANNDSRAAQRLAERVLTEFGEDGTNQKEHIALSKMTAGMASLNQLDALGSLNYLLSATHSARLAASDATLVRALQRLVTVQVVLGRIGDAFATFDELQGLGGATITGEHSAACAAISAASAVRGDFAVALAHANDGLELVDVTDYRFMETALISNATFNYIQLGDYDAALQVIGRLETDRPRRAAELLRQCVGSARDPQLIEALSENNRLSALDERSPDVGELARVAMLAELALASNDREVLLGLLPKLQIAERAGVIFPLAWPVQLPLLLGRLCIALGKERDAHYYFRRSLDYGRLNDLHGQLEALQRTLASDWPQEQELFADVVLALDEQGQGAHNI